MDLIKELEQEYMKKKLPEIRSGDTVCVHQKIHEKDKKKTQIFEGLVIKRRGGKGLSGTFTVRKIASGGIGVERIFPLHSPLISKIQIIKKGKVRRAQLYYIRRKHLKSLKLKEKKEYRGIKEWEEEIKKPEPKKEKEEKKEEKPEVKEKKEEKIEESKRAQNGAEAKKEKRRKKSEGFEEEKK
jgi:large subunit ribosomal protein L19